MAAAEAPSDDEDDLSNLSEIMSRYSSDSYVALKFDETFQFLQVKAEKVSADDDVIDNKMKRLLIDLMNEQRGQVMRAWIANKAVGKFSADGQDDKKLKGMQQDALNELDEASFKQFIRLLTDEELSQLLKLILPIVKLEPGRYLIGAKVRLIQFKNENLWARVGGGYTKLADLMAAEAKIDCSQISAQMAKKGQSFHKAVIDILVQKQAGDKVIQQYIRDHKDDQIPFLPILEAIREREVKTWNKRKK